MNKVSLCLPPSIFKYPLIVTQVYIAMELSHSLFLVFSYLNQVTKGLWAHSSCHFFLDVPHASPSRSSIVQSWTIYFLISIHFLIYFLY